MDVFSQFVSDLQLLYDLDQISEEIFRKKRGVVDAAQSSEDPSKAISLAFASGVLDEDEFRMFKDLPKSNGQTEDPYGLMAKAAEPNSAQAESDSTSTKPDSTSTNTESAPGPEKVRRAEKSFLVGDTVRFEGEYGWVVDSYITDGPNGGWPVIKKGNRVLLPSPEELKNQNFADVIYRGERLKVVFIDPEKDELTLKNEKTKVRTVTKRENVKY